ncbi:50S ribosomal protein L18 [Candidatus Parcubacteria bacterium]|nr:50S ribosomal protein L18 [Candidatus Parcubacteria bacterium]
MFKKMLEKRIRRHARIRSKVSGTAVKPRFSVSKSNKNLIAQLIDDQKAETLAYVWTQKMDGKSLREKSIAAGKEIAKLAEAKKIKEVAFDRGGFIYTGNIKALADAAREAGLKF